MAVAKKKATRTCSICSEPGHNARTCPQKDAEVDAEVAEEEWEEEEELPEEAEDEEEDEEEEPEEKVAPVATKAQLKAMEKAESAFSAFLDKTRKAFPGSVERADLLTQKIPRISTGNLGLDIATFGGLPRGRIIRFYGKEKSAKSGSAWNTVATWQHQHCGICYERGPCEHGTESGVDRPKAKVLWIDAEHRVADMYYWPEGHGVDLEHLLVQEPPSGQFIVDFVHAAIREHGAGIGLIVVDSVANFTSQEEIDKATRKGRTAPVNALLMNKALRIWPSAVCDLGVAESKKPTIILINQVRQTMDAFASPEVLPGGKGQDFATSLDIRFASKKYHYLVENDKGEIEDKCKSFGSRWKPDADDTPYYVEINYRVTSSGICPNGRYGQFNYWLRKGHGRRLGDPDNIDKMWDYVKRLKLMEKEGRGYRLFHIEESTQTKIKESFYADRDAQTKVWAEIVEKLIDV